MLIIGRRVPLRAHGSIWASRTASGKLLGGRRDASGICLGSLVLLHLGTHGSYRAAVWKPPEKWNGGHYSVLGCILFYYIVYCVHPVEWSGGHSSVLVDLLIHSSSGCCLIVGSLWDVSACFLWVCADCLGDCFERLRLASNRLV